MHLLLSSRGLAMMLLKILRRNRNVQRRYKSSCSHIIYTSGSTHFLGIRVRSMLRQIERYGFVPAVRALSHSLSSPERRSSNCVQKEVVVGFPDVEGAVTAHT